MSGTFYRSECDGATSYTRTDLHEKVQIKCAELQNKYE